MTITVMISVYPILGIGRSNVDDIAYAKIDASTPDDKILQIRYPPTMDISVGNGPIQASVYCARPPVVFGISAFNSESEATVVILSKHATIIARMNMIPIVPAPCPKDTRQLVAMTSPTDTEMTLPRPSFFSSIFTSFLRCTTDLSNLQSTAPVPINFQLSFCYFFLRF